MIIIGKITIEPLHILGCMNIGIGGTMNMAIGLKDTKQYMKSKKALIMHGGKDHIIH